MLIVVAPDALDILELSNVRNGVQGFRETRFSNQIANEDELVATARILDRV